MADRKAAFMYKYRIKTEKQNKQSNSKTHMNNRMSHRNTGTIGEINITNDPSVILAIVYKMPG